MDETQRDRITEFSKLKDENPFSEAFKSYKKELATKIENEQGKWHTHHFEGSDKGSFCLGMRCTLCKEGNADFQLAHLWENGLCTGKMCKTCKYENSEYSNACNSEIKGKCHGLKCATCKKP